MWPVLMTGPTAPRQLTWLIVGSNGVHLSWLPPAEPNGIITSYIISYCRDASELYTTTAGVCNTQKVHGELLLNVGEELVACCRGETVVIVLPRTKMLNVSCLKSAHYLLLLLLLPFYGHYTGQSALASTPS